MSETKAINVDQSATKIADEICNLIKFTSRDERTNTYVMIGETISADRLRIMRLNDNHRELFRRDQFAMAAMQGMIVANKDDWNVANPFGVARRAIMYADTLISELDKKENVK